jgi:hypothetical protein
MEQILLELQKDQQSIGTSFYTGKAFFWNGQYKHILRNCSREDRKLVHDKWLELGLELDGVSDEHKNILNSIK